MHFRRRIHTATHSHDAFPVYFCDALGFLVTHFCDAVKSFAGFLRCNPVLAWAEYLQFLTALHLNCPEGKLHCGKIIYGGNYLRGHTPEF